MTEDQIERRVEAMTDRADAALTKGLLTTAAYEAEIKRIDAWAEDAWKKLASRVEVSR